MNVLNKNKVYLFDTNVLIDLSVWLPVSLNKVFWEKLTEALRDGVWILLDVVMNEIRGDNDGLKDWCKNQEKSGFIKNIDDIHRERGIEINSTYKMIDETSFRSTVDTYLIAYAEANGLAIFSRESRRKKLDDLYKIPDVCKVLNIPTLRVPKVFFELIGYKN
ncbi:hypothetical protein A3I34_00470 [Candidatus Jorgensenbacteria bacterium RIFCSPLOWO2_02_FULL_45_12]|uniref:PIN domain-containing protein n=1 Tax=Candidatus Jorgensenbacteria bacterium RIFCSPHIGHO2_02_FULL_45_20 TaxID=1798470 RepID=A0A1F6BPQ1_9BACT|nr:MAG: hypothetical protein A3D55_02830 [Candidatus Jorgensenbacteria bacterium RIFCSPHIGHO2_02_FULL_45_20]OGG42393.1 MAG: hypothetical protein A3I34_00470 [Candidatus Jorgensenbacteria bacterium RIFCSPLOWO2_02_FULL_45_12]